jgi:hypothetical protein
MGLLDGLINMTPEQNRSLMAASAKMLELSGPSRTPRSFGQIAGAAYGTFNDTMDEQQQRAALQRQQAMTEQILGWKAKDAEADYGATQGAREREARIAKRLAGMFGGGADAGGGDPGQGLPNGSPQMSQMTTLTRHGMTPGQAAAIAFGGGGAQGQQGMPDVGSQEWMQGIQQQAGMAPGGMARPGAGPGAGPMGEQPAPAPGQPDWFAMGMPPQMALGMQQGKKVNRTQQMLDNMMSKAQIQLEEGDEAGLAKTLNAIQKFRPSAVWEKVKKDGKVVNMPLFNDGTEGEASSAEAAEKLHWEDTGAATFGLDAYDGSVKARYQNSMTPDGAASNSVARANLQLSRERIGLERERIDQGRNTVVQGDGGPLMVNTRTNQAMPIIGPNGQPVGPKLRDVPGTVRKTLFENDAALRKVDDALKAVEAYPAALGVRNYMGDTIRQRSDPEGVRARALVADIGSLKLHDRSGAAVTASETPRLKPFIPTATDDQATVKKKLGLFREEYDQIQQDIRETYSREQGYRTPEGRQPRVDISAIPARAQGHLKMDPKSRDQFDAKYGAGAAAAVLGK